MREREDGSKLLPSSPPYARMQESKEERDLGEREAGGERGG